MIAKLVRPFKRIYQRGGFSLVEVVMALGIISFAIVGIMGLLPVAMRSALESQRETRAAQIAQQIFSDLRSGQPATTYLAIGTNILDSAQRTPVNLTSLQSYQVAFNGEGMPVGTAPGATTTFLALVRVSPNVPASGLSSVWVTVNAPPGAATATNRSYMFSSVLSQ